MSAGMTVAAMVPSAPPFLSLESSFINCASLKASAPVIRDCPPPGLYPAPLKAIVPPGVDFVGPKPMAPARGVFDSGVRFMALFFLLLGAFRVFIGVSSSLCRFNVLRRSTIVPLPCSRSRVHRRRQIYQQ